MRELKDFNLKNNYNAWDNKKLSDEKLEEAKLKVSKDIKNIKIIENIEINNESWENFYKKHLKNFFSDRKWILKHFPLIIQSKNIFELGCGVGNSLSILHETNQNIKLSGCDFSETSIKLCSERIKGNFFKHDITTPLINYNIKHDTCLLIFTLSAIHPNKHQNVINNIKKILNKGGILYFNDYGLYDMIQLRYKSDSIIMENFYKRSDGTFTYFFNIEKFKNFMEMNSFKVIDLKEVNQLLINRKKNIDMYRIFLRGIFKLV